MKVERLPVRDEYVEGDQCVVLLESGQVLALTPVATHILTVLEGRSLEVTELIDALTSRFGPPPTDGAGDIDALRFVTELVDLGLLRKA